MDLSSTIKSIQDIMRKDDGVDGDAQRIGQLAWMLFLKIFDQCEEAWEDDAADRGEEYVSPLPEDCRWRNWAKYHVNEDGKRQPQIAASELIRHVNNTVFPGLQNLIIDSEPKAKVVRDVFEDTNNYMKSGTLMLGVIEKLDETVDFHDFKTRQHLGDIYEQVLNDLRSAGNAGEFYTPRAITKFMVQMVNPRLKKREVVLDPACGTGGFLTATIGHFEAQVTKKSGAEDRKAIAACIRGMEKKQLPHLLCVTNMLLHGIEVPSQIEHRNTLAIGWNNWQLTERVDCVITNPPFGGLEDEGVGADYPSDLRTRETADMFLTLIVKKLLKDKGRGAIVLPDGTLFGEGVKSKVKELLLRECNLHTIIRLPNGVFNPYAGIKTNLLFFTKGKPTETIWFYEHRYPEGQRSYSKTKPLGLEELQPIVEWWGNERGGFKDRVETDQAWKINFKQRRQEALAKAQPYWDQADSLTNQASDLNEELKRLRAATRSEKKMAERKKLEQQVERMETQLESVRQKAKDQRATGDRHYWPIYNLDIRNPNVPEEESHDPDALLQKYRKVVSEIEDTERQLYEQLAAALSRQSVDEGRGNER
jgi:type I restriction enzyme M protein